VTADFTPKPGQNIFRDVTTDLITGKPHKVKVCGPWLQFDGDEPIQLPEPGMHVRLDVREGIKRALVRGHDSDHVYLVRPQAIDDIGRCKGDYPAAFDSDGRWHIQRDNSRPDYSAEGIHHIEPDGRWVMNNAIELNSVVTVGSETIAVLQTDRAFPYAVGKCDRLTNSGVARSGPNGLEHYGQYTQFPPFVNAQGWVAIQGSEWKMTPEPDAVPWIRHEDLPATPGPIVTPAPPVAPPPPAPADCTAEKALIVILTRERNEAQLALRVADDLTNYLQGQLAAAQSQRDLNLTPGQVIKLVNDATGQMAGYWRYLGVQGAVDRAVKAELARRK
jgi:hypothetical protein